MDSIAALGYYSDNLRNSIPEMSDNDITPLYVQFAMEKYGHMSKFNIRQSQKAKYKIAYGRGFIQRKYSGMRSFDFLGRFADLEHRSVHINKTLKNKSVYLYTEDNYVEFK